MRTPSPRPTPPQRPRRLAAWAAGPLLAAAALLAGCGGGGAEDPGHGVISASASSLSFTGPAPAPQTLSISYVSPPTEVVLAGFPAGPNPTCIGSDATCRLAVTLASTVAANPQVYTVTIMDTSASHSSTLRFVSTDAGFQTDFGHVDVTVRYTP